MVFPGIIRSVEYYVVHIRLVVFQIIFVKDCRRGQLEKGMSWVDAPWQVESHMVASVEGV